MIQTLIAFWIVAALMIAWEQKVARIIIYFGVFSLLTAGCFMLLGSVDLGMAEAIASAFATIFFIVCIEKYYNFEYSDQRVEKQKMLTRCKPYIAPFFLTLLLFGLFINFVPQTVAGSYLKEQYISMFVRDIGGYNVVTAIYLGYRVYDTLFEALLLVVAVMSATHLSWHNEEVVNEGAHSAIEKDAPTIFSIRIVCPIIILFGLYIITNGHFTPGGGFQGGLIIASFFVCRYLIYNIYDTPMRRIMVMEEALFSAIVLMAVLIVFYDVTTFLPAERLPLFKGIYLVLMNVLIGMKVACAFLILLYRYIAIERK